MHRRLIVYPKDIMMITGRSKSYRTIMAEQIRKKNGKEKKGLILLREFCERGNRKRRIFQHN